MIIVCVVYLLLIIVYVRPVSISYIYRAMLLVAISRCYGECGCAAPVPLQCHVWQAAVSHFEFQLEFGPQRPVTARPILSSYPIRPWVTPSLSLSPDALLSLSIAHPHRPAIAVPLCHAPAVSRRLLVFFFVANRY